MSNGIDAAPQTAPPPQESPPQESPKAAEEAGLRYLVDTGPGIRREPKGENTFRYRGPDGQVITDKQVLERIHRLVIPPAWTEVWISPDPHGHLQATGRDARRRKQYRYHERWREVRDQAKFDRTIAFGSALPAIRQQVAADLRKPGLPREKVLAAVVALIERTLIRVGNDEYARANESFGATTLRDEHAKVRGDTVHLKFRAKSGKVQDLSLQDRRLARIIKACQDLPGQELFQYVDDDGAVVDVGSGDVNEYLRGITGQPFTAKDFRTFAGTVLAAVALCECELATTKTAERRLLKQVVEKVANQLGNTVAVCRKAYIHPDVFEAWRDGSLAGVIKASSSEEALNEDEKAIIALLAERSRTLRPAPTSKRRRPTKSKAKAA